MKLAVSGKGGVGKSTLASMLALMLARKGRRVLAVDADHDANLAQALGIDDETQKSISPIAEQKVLIEERTGAKVKQFGQMFKLNPDVADIAETHAITHQGVALLVLGAIEAGGSGCACPESVLLRSLVSELVLRRDDALILDMEAGVEHLGRGTAKGVDAMVIVVEPGRRSVDSAKRIRGMAEEIGIDAIFVVANKVGSKEDVDWLKQSLGDSEPIGYIPLSDSFRIAERAQKNALEFVGEEVLEELESLLAKLEELTK